MSTESNRVAGPTIPERFLDVPSQRLYVLSLAALLQVRLLLSRVIPHPTSVGFYKRHVEPPHLVGFKSNFVVCCRPSNYLTSFVSWSRTRAKRYTEENGS